MLDPALLEMCGLDDFEAFRLSTIGRDPDRTSRRPMSRRICREAFEDNAEIVQVFATKTAEDRKLWRRYLGPK